MGNSNKYILLLFVSLLLGAIPGCRRDISKKAFKAAGKGNLSVLQGILENYPDMIDIMDERGLTLLHWAVSHQRKEVVNYLIAKGANLEIRAPTGWTMLHYSALEGYNDIAKLLIDGGAEINTRDREGNTPLHYSAMNSYCLLDITEALISKGGDVNAKNLLEQTPLHAVAQCAFEEENVLETIRLLIRHSKDVNALDIFGCTPLFYANELGHKQKSQLLQQLGGITKQEPVDPAKIDSRIPGRSKEDMEGLQHKFTTWSRLNREFKELEK